MTIVIICTKKLHANRIGGIIFPYPPPTCFWHMFLMFIGNKGVLQMTTLLVRANSRISFVCFYIWTTTQLHAFELFSSSFLLKVQSIGHIEPTNHRVMEMLTSGIQVFGVLVYQHTQRTIKARSFCNKTQLKLSLDKVVGHCFATVLCLCCNCFVHQKWVILGYNLLPFFLYDVVPIFCGFG